ncbi:MAG: aminotransferase class V-fold PLP-dependent enzyme [Chloroflexi bacterium]|nr:aminotransferase class V-fold PLP-dependent enzyme [Chloroflexota bacterium]
MPSTSSTGSAQFDSLGLKRVINGRSWVTILGGSRMPEEVQNAMVEAASTFIDFHELNRRAGERIAQYTGAEAGLVVAGASTGLLVQAAACMAGSNPDRILQLPDTTGMKDEILIYEKHRFGFEICYRTAGAKLKEWGLGEGSLAEQLAGSIDENTAAVAYVFSPWMSCDLSLREVVSIAHERDVPVIVDGAAMLPPADNLKRYIADGADLVTFSGGKGVRGPQSTGILAGRKDLVEAARLNMSPHASVGRACKVAKEEIAGLLAALDRFVSLDHEEMWATWRNWSETITAAGSGITGLRPVIEDGDPNRQGPTAVFYFEPDWDGPSSKDIQEKLASGDPSIHVGVGSYGDELYVSPVALEQGEAEIVAQALRSEFR